MRRTRKAGLDAARRSVHADAKPSGRRSSRKIAGLLASVSKAGHSDLVTQYGRITNSKERRRARAHMRDLLVDAGVEEQTSPKPKSSEERLVRHDIDCKCDRCRSYERFWRRYNKENPLHGARCGCAQCGKWVSTRVMLRPKPRIKVRWKSQKDEYALTDTGYLYRRIGKEEKFSKVRDKQVKGDTILDRARRVRKFLKNRGRYLEKEV